MKTTPNIKRCAVQLQADYICNRPELTAQLYLLLMTFCFLGRVIWSLTLQIEILQFFMHYKGVIMGAIASQITSLNIVYSTVYSDADQRKHQSPASLAFMRGSHRGPVNSPHKWPITRNTFPFDDVIMAQPTQYQFSEGNHCIHSGAWNLHFGHMYIITIN